LEKEYGDAAYYVHLLRRREDVARSIITRGEDSIIFSFASGVLQHYRQARTLSEQQRYEIGLQYWDTINDNIQLFLRGKTKQITLWLHEIEEPFQRFWREISAEGDLGGALAEWNVRHNPRKTVALGWSSLDQQFAAVQQRLAAIIPRGRRFILVDEDQDGELETLAGRTRVPFLNQQGMYWGPPANDEVAVRELTRLREDGVCFIAFAAPGLWWLSHYANFHCHLRSQFRCVFEDSSLVVFDLAGVASPAAVPSLVESNAVSERSLL
jgi:hypothetical protein